MSASRPILFSGPMVRAILGGWKTQTRRIAPAARWRRHIAWIGPSGADKDDPSNWGFEDEHGDWWVLGGADSRDRTTNNLPCPYGEPGDLLWVREAWQPLWNGEERPSSLKHPEGWAISYPATAGIVEYHDPDAGLVNRCRRPIHMPRWASRINLVVEHVRVERLQAISEEDAIADGIRELPGQEGAPGAWWTGDVATGPVLHGRTPRDAFLMLWKSINAKRAQKRPIAWADNPFVYAITFRQEHTK